MEEKGDQWATGEGDEGLWTIAVDDEQSLLPAFKKVQ